MLTRDVAVQLVKDFVKACEEQRIFFTKVILFGSTAQDTATQDSDIDVLLVSDQFEMNQWKNAGLIARINKKFSLIEAHTYPTAYFLKGDPFINEAKSTGIEIA